MPDLKEYIKDLRQKGYALSDIRDYLLRYGYTQDIVDHAIYNLNDKKEIRINPVLIFSVIAILALAGGAGYFMLKPDAKVPGELLDVKIESQDSSVAPGDDISAKILLTNMGAKNTYDVYAKYEIFDKAGKRITFKSETLALETEKKQEMLLTIPDTAAEGEYVLQITARYQADTARAQAPFSVKRMQTEATCTDKIKNQGEEDVDCGGTCASCRKCPASCDDNNPLTVEYCDASTDFECKYTTPNVCGNNRCEESETAVSCADDCRTVEPPSLNSWDELDKIKLLAETNPDEARGRCSAMDEGFKDLCLQNVGIASKNPNICSTIADEAKKDRCFSDVAKDTGKPVLCENIAKESRRDGCYVNFLSQNDYSVCEKINNPYLKQSCETLRQTQQ